MRWRPVRPAGWWPDALLVVALVGLTAALWWQPLLDLDVAVRDWVRAHQLPVVYWTARVVNYLGQGGQVLLPAAALLALWLAWRTRSARPVLPVLAVWVATYLTIGPMKLGLDRAYPRSYEIPDAVRLFSDPAAGKAYPSGHVANAVVWFAVIVLLTGGLRWAYGRPPLPRRAVLALRALPPVIVSCTTVYVLHHWVTDVVAGLLLGLTLSRLLARVPWDDLPLPAFLGGWRAPAGLPHPGDPAVPAAAGRDAPTRTR